MSKSNFIDPRAFVQRSSFKTSLSVDTYSYVDKSKDVEIVKDLMSSIRQTPEALAIAANQRGYLRPIFVSKFPLDLLNEFPFAEKLTKEHFKSLQKLIQPTIYLFPAYVGAEASASVRSLESCLSLNYGETLVEVERPHTIDTVSRVLDMNAYSRNKRRLMFHTVEQRLSGLAAQIYQHEVDHLQGYGIWDIGNFNYDR